MAAFMLRADPCGPFHPLSTSIATKRNALTPSDHHAVFSRSYKPHNSPPPQLRPSFKERPICSACICHGCLKRIELYQQGSSVNWHISPAWKQRRAWAFRKYHTLEVRNHSNGMAANNNRKTEAKVPEQAEAEVDVGALEARAGLGRRARKQRQSKGEELQVGNRDKSQTIPKRKKDWQKMHRLEDKDVEDAAAEAALETLFSQLEQDLEEADLSGEDSSDTITEEELVAFEQDLSGILDAEEKEELTKAPCSKKLMKEHDKNFHFGTSQKHGQVQDNENLTVSKGDSDKNSKTSRKFDASRQLDLGNSMCLGRDMKTTYTEKGEAADNPHRILDDTTNTVADDGEEGESEDGERVIKLEKWQLKKLASAAEIGRRRVNIKSLAAEVGLDRSDVLSFLRDPPPELLTAVLDETFKESVNSTSEIIDNTSSHRENATPVSLDEKKKGPHTSRPTSWYSQKRLRKEVVNTFELVYRRTKRPTNSMIQNIVELTHVPRRRILQWFEDRRGENVPKNVTLEKVTD